MKQGNVYINGKLAIPNPNLIKSCGVVWTEYINGKLIKSNNK
jgi:hypothetical protein